MKSRSPLPAIASREVVRGLTERRIRRWSWSVLWCMIPVFAVGPAYAVAPFPIVACVDRDDFYVLRHHPRPDIKAPNNDGYYELLRRPIDAAAEQPRGVPDYEMFPLNGWNVASRMPARVRVRYGTVWLFADAIFFAGLSVTCFPVGDLPFYDKRDPQRKQGFAKKYGEPDIFAFTLTLIPVCDEARTLDRYPDECFQGYKDRHDQQYAMATRFAFCDFLPTSATTGTAFFLYRDHCLTWDSRPPSPPGADGRVKSNWPEKPSAEFNIGFTEPFSVFVKDKTYLFVTESGKLYTATRGAKGVWTTRKAWADPDCPIRLVLSDAATGRTFAYTVGTPTKDRPNIGSEYFELDSDPVARPLPSPLVPLNTDQPIPSVRTFAQALRKAGELGPAKPKAP